MWRACEKSGNLQHSDTLFTHERLEREHLHLGDECASRHDQTNSTLFCLFSQSRIHVGVVTN